MGDGQSVKTYRRAVEEGNCGWPIAIAVGPPVARCLAELLRDLPWLRRLRVGLSCRATEMR
jgi:hypothetical protein